MKDPSFIVRKGLFDVLNGNISYDSSNVPVYNVVPDNATYPYIVIYSVSTNQIENNQTNYISGVDTTLEVVTRFSSSSGGQLQSNKIINSIAQLIILKSGLLDLSSDNFNVYSQTNEGITYLTEDLPDHTYYRGILSMSVKLEQI
tara:strand:+ start:10196 stop:10630 length:435 start_codon:yes stop_codon:yes gene_type:complete